MNMGIYGLVLIAISILAYLIWLLHQWSLVDKYGKSEKTEDDTSIGELISHCVLGISLVSLISSSISSLTIGNHAIVIWFVISCILYVIGFTMTIVIAERELNRNRINEKGIYQNPNRVS